MPGFDGTGPRGMGPMTGGGRGFCSPWGVGRAYYGTGIGRGGRFRAFGGGFGAGFAGRGLGFGRGYPPAWGSDAWPQYGAEGSTAGLENLQDQIRGLQDQLRGIERRIRELNA